MVTGVASIVKRELIKLGWYATVNEYVITKNGYHLHLDNVVRELNVTHKFSYSDEDIATVIANDYNFTGINLKQPIIKLDNDLKLNGVGYYMVKFGWLICKGKYDSEFSYLVGGELEGESKIIDKFREFIGELDAYAERDYVGMRGVKQQLVTGVKLEDVMQATISNEPIAEGCILQVQEDSDLCDIFTKGSLFELALILDEAVIVTAINKKGTKLNKNYEIEANIILKEASSHNIRTVTLSPATEEVEYTYWQKFRETDLVNALPIAINSLIASDKQREYVREAFNSNLNYSILLNPLLNDGALSTMLQIANEGYVNSKLFNMYVGDTEAQIYLQAIKMGYDPNYYIDESYDPLSLKDDFSGDLEKLASYRNSISSGELSEEVINLLCKYKFEQREVFPIACNSSTRWQFLLPYFYDFLGDTDTSDLSNLIKMYGVLNSEGCYLKIDFLDGKMKGLLLNYFKAPSSFVFNGKSWEDFIFELLNSPIKIMMDIRGIGLKGDAYVIRRDYNSIFVEDLLGKPVWRCVFINEETYISCSIDQFIYF